MATQADNVTEAPKVGFYRWYFLFLLMTLNLMLIWDKVILTTLFEPIREEFGVTDGQLGIIGGTVYAIFMGVAGLPLGYLADRTNRRNLAAGCLLFWSAATAACGMAQNLPQLVMARLCVGVGEAGGGPAAISMIADLFERRRRATAMALFMFGASLAGLINLTVTSNVSHAWGWRAALLVAAVPGVVIALLLLFTVREPVRGASDKVVAPPKAPPLRDTLRFIAKQKSLVFILLGSTLSYITIAGMSSWTFSFIIRVHETPLKEIAFPLGIGFVIGGLLGNALGGSLVDHMAQRDERWRVWIIAIGAVVSVGVGAVSVMVGDITSFIVLTATFAGLAIFWFGSASSLSQSLVEIRMRSTVGGIFFLLSNMVGYGLGPVIVGFLSDYYQPSFGEESLRYAMFTMVFCNCLSALAFYMAGRSLRKDLDTAAAADA
ncbi:MFS transporter [Sphingomonas sp. AOB5]|uniref:spinster family MFS transporter n=1 Tax=Sphingomonas sp. AOB5 TaxID=3034017 RepID=UPI0023F93A13|nr:MFS transporter [Sphingomonas sp. AOB5]MDF7776443.1 MFS transporter [Sphingomonas sp. AOB5]